jgi:hypothetical protein
MIDEFSNRYDARIAVVPRNHTSYWNNEYLSEDYQTNTVEVVLSRTQFEHLIAADCEAEEDWRRRREEADIRRHHPAVADAYSQYKMLLELCR